MSNLIVFPINFLVAWLFRKSRVRVKRPSRLKMALDEQVKRYQTKEEPEPEVRKFLLYFSKSIVLYIIVFFKVL